MGEAAAWYPNANGGYDITVFATLPGHVSSYATAVNNLGDIIGSSSDGTYIYPVLFTALGDGGEPQDLTATGIFKPADINDQRILVDRSFTSKTLNLNTMEVQDLGVPAGPPNYLASTGAAISNSGQVAGVVILATSTNCDRQAARYTPGTGWQVLSGCGPYNGAHDINDLGDVIMRLNVAPYVRFEGIGTFLIEDLIEEDEGHWFVINGFGLSINDSRQMAVPATNPVTNETGVILLTPIPTLGDLTGDGVVDGADLALLLGVWGLCVNCDTPADCPADLDGDCEVTGADLAILLGNWG